MRTSLLIPLISFSGAFGAVNITHGPVRPDDLPQWNSSNSTTIPGHLTQPPIVINCTIITLEGGNITCASNGTNSTVPAGNDTRVRERRDVLPLLWTSNDTSLVPHKTLRRRSRTAPKPKSRNTPLRPGVFSVEDTSDTAQSLQTRASPVEQYYTCAHPSNFHRDHEFHPFHYRILPNVDFVGGDFSAVTLPEHTTDVVKECAHQCALAQSQGFFCSGAVMEKEGNVCYLKSDLGTGCGESSKRHHTAIVAKYHSF